MALSTYTYEAGRAHPMGATPDGEGVNFSVFSDRATAVELLIFDEHDAVEPVATVKLDPRVHKTFHFWHVYVRGLRPGTHYAYRVDGPRDVHGQGDRFLPAKVLIDPYARGNTATLWRRGSAVGEGDNLAESMRSVVVDTESYDWEGDQPIRRPMAETVIYELHVGGFTRSPSSGVRHPGTFSGVIEKIPYLKQLGVTAVELMPVCEFDPGEIDRPGPDGTGRLSNYWGYSTVGFFAPHSGYCVRPEVGAQIDEFRDMVKALHRAGIEVILDVVFNHTSEGNHGGPTFSFKGLANGTYYHLVNNDRQYYMDYSGCGNTVNCNHPIVDKFVLDCLEYWVREMHVDGFRFDEGSILTRDQDGSSMRYPPVLWHIELSEVLADAKIIAEAWDAAGLYQVGYFPGFRWAEWNGRFRDDIRRFVRGDGGLIGAVAARLSGSADLYESSSHLPINSVNFVSCHDGFTLNDLVSYNGKHNEANGEDNRDGNDDNLSWNCGVEGPSGDPATEQLRCQQLKNFMAMLLLSQGVPMLGAGDEVRRTQRGNNNAYCHDDELSWFDWRGVEQNLELLRFTREMIALRKAHPAIHRSRFFSGAVNARGLPDVAWHGCRLNAPGWSDAASRVLAYTLGGEDDDADLHVILNMDSTGLEFDVPDLGARRWVRVVDTGQPSPLDVCDLATAPVVKGPTLRVFARSVVVLLSR